MKYEVCAYVLCGKPLSPERQKHEQAIYCDNGGKCYRNAKKYRWRHRKPEKAAAARRRYKARKLREHVKTTYAQRRRPLATQVEKQALGDGRESLAKAVG